ncbi:50S ribosomal protein L9 [bioreactor metagenome]|uniref:50S ribosomal protein L9 n=1 Tax=bioreactor metagenome TaxID=1076179 RepID=A0A645JN95_9ZZZZ
MEATADALNAKKNADAAASYKIEQEKAAARELKKVLESSPVKIFARAGTGGKLFGSVTTKEISEALKAQHNIDLPKNQLSLDEPIKGFGTFEAKAKLYSEITGTVFVQVFEEK